jgi:hypothetical protein
VGGNAEKRKLIKAVECPNSLREVNKVEIELNSGTHKY